MDFNHSTGDVFVISGPSGTGKSTIRREILKLFPELKFSISYTTRAPRKEEQDKVDYHFISRRQFEDMIKKDEFVEWAEVHGDLYGTPSKELKSAIAKGELLLLEIDVQGGAKIKKKFPEAVLIFILPPRLEELEKRLQARAMNSQEEIKCRLQVARKEIQAGKNYDYLVLNNSLKYCVEQIKAIITCQRCRSQRQMPLVNSILTNS